MAPGFVSHLSRRSTVSFCSSLSKAQLPVLVVSRTVQAESIRMQSHRLLSFARFDVLGQEGFVAEIQQHFSLKWFERLVAPAE